MGKQSDALGAKLRRGIAKAAAALVLEANRQLRLAPPIGTPVQDGNARANWIPSVGQPSNATGQAASVAGAAQVASYALGQGDLYLVNRTPYIKRLNDGYSKQSPALFVETALERAKTKVQAMLRKAGSSVDLGGLGIAEDQSAQDVSGDAAGNVAGAYSPFGGDE